jgi:hypothetical protein
MTDEELLINIQLVMVIILLSALAVIVRWLPLSTRGL